MIIQNVKGGYDFLPKEQKIRNYINDTLRTIFEEYGYNPIETPILCYYDILSDKYDEESDILKEIYKLTDQGDRKLGLRYDLTVPFAKFIAINQNQISMPFKRYEINKVFRDGPVKVGRDREFTQCDVDVVGLTGNLIEAELLMLYYEAFKRLGIDIIIKYNSRKLMTGLILESNVEESLVPTVTAILDKFEKLSREEISNNLIEVGVSKESVEKLLASFAYSLEELNEKYKDTSNEKLREGLEEINNLKAYLQKLNIDEDSIFTPSLARGQNYYTGNVFEVYDKKGRLTGSIGGGGRYDNMVTEFISDGNSYPAVGISFGLTSIYELLKNEERFEDKSIIDIYIIPMNTGAESLSLATKLRNMGYKVEVEMYRTKIKKALDFANREKIPYAVIVGEDEINNNKVTFKDMFNQNNFEISLSDVEKVKEYIKK